MNTRLIAAVVLSSSVLASPYAATYTDNSCIPYVEKWSSSTLEGESFPVMEYNRDRSLDKPPILNEALNLVGEIIELTDEDLAYYHQSIIKHSKVLEGSYFD